MSQQLPLTLRWPAQQRFDSYISDGNAAAVNAALDIGGAKVPLKTQDYAPKPA